MACLIDYYRFSKYFSVKLITGACLKNPANETTSQNPWYFVENFSAGVLLLSNGTWLKECLLQYSPFYSRMWGGLHQINKFESNLTIYGISKMVKLENNSAVTWYQSPTKPADKKQKDEKSVQRMSQNYDFNMTPQETFLGEADFLFGFWWHFCVGERRLKGLR